MKYLELREKRMNLVKQAQDILTAAPDSGMSPEDEKRFDGLMAEADTLKSNIERAERAEAETRELEAHYKPGIKPDTRGGDDPEKAESETRKAESAAFSAYLRGGVEGLRPEQRQVLAERRNSPEFRSLAEGTGSAGGFLVPQDFYRKLTEALKLYGGMRNTATILQTSTGATMPFPMVNDTSNLGAIVGENTQVTETDMAFSSVSLGAYTFTSKIVTVPLNLVQDSAFDLDSYLARALGIRIGRIQNNKFTVGSGSSEPQGVVGVATLGVTGAIGQTTSVIYDNLVDLEHSVDPLYRQLPSCKWMFADSTLKAIKKIKDSQNRPIWMAGLSETAPDNILGYGYQINQDVAAMGASAKSILFGDFSNYVIRDVLGVQILRLTERYADFLQVGYLAFARADGNLLDAGTHPVAYYANSAS